VVAVGEGGPRTLVEDGVSGVLADADPGALADAVVSVAGSPVLARRLSEGGLRSVTARSWEASLEQLAAGYRRALGGGVAPAVPLAV
jgi:glycosyltransferase involved in cell wall biosynthesis